MLKRTVIAVLLVAAGAVGANAQQIPHYSQYLLNGYVMNPAMGGSKPYWDARSSNRYQWVGITDSPRTYVLSMNGPLNNDKMGMGGHLFTDITGPTRRTGFQISYAYHLKLNESMKLGFGVSGGLLQFMVDGSKIIFRDDGDVALSGGVQAVTVPDAGAGLYFYSDKFFLSVSAPQLIPYKLQFFENYPNTQSQLVNHLFASGGYKFPLGDDFELEPSFLVKYVNPIPVQAELTLRAIYQDAVWLGASYRTEDAIALMIGYTFQKNLMLGYSYDLIQSNLGNYSRGSHEIMLGVKFKKRKTKSAGSTSSGTAAPAE